MGTKPAGREVGVASIRKPEMSSVLERHVSVMAESLTSEMRTRRGGLMSGVGREPEVSRLLHDYMHVNRNAAFPKDSLSTVVISSWTGRLVREFFKA